ncbi:MAG: SMC-Scp complex subunit ScpB [Spirochaetales bacterium]|nr:SMC-Scp complex subunit ScpB [Spirochaetales bacterium]MBR6348528.1 SMC-Scp complex subunit ScpB [Spirochaetales bacterium]
MNISDNAAFIEALLFLENEPMSVERLQKMTGLSEKQVTEALEELTEAYYADNHGLSLVENAETYSFVPVTRLNDKLRSCYGKKIDKRLSKAALETLAIVAYSQPITRGEITKIRGVVSDSIIRILRERDYIKVVGRKDVQGHPCLYGTTRKFLYTFKLESISELPKLSETDRLRFEKDQNEN